MDLRLLFTYSKKVKVLVILKIPWKPLKLTLNRGT